VRTLADCHTEPVPAVDATTVATLVALLSGGLAIAVSSWRPVHDCGNRYCRHVEREEEPGWRRP
jgi:hypothetical protein